MLSEGPKTIDITGFFKKFCIATGTIKPPFLFENGGFLLLFITYCWVRFLFFIEWSAR